MDVSRLDLEKVRISARKADADNALHLSACLLLQSTSTILEKFSHGPVELLLPAQTIMWPKKFNRGASSVSSCHVQKATTAMWTAWLEMDGHRLRLPKQDPLPPSLVLPQQEHSTVEVKQGSNAQIREVVEYYGGKMLMDTTSDETLSTCPWLTLPPPHKCQWEPGSATQCPLWPI